MRTGRLCDLCYSEPCVPDMAEVIGWAKTRRDGGTNHVRAKRETGRRIGQECLRKLEHGELAGQGDLPLNLDAMAS